MVQEVSGEGRVASQPGSQPSASAADASSPVGADPSRISDILDRAADLIEPKGAWYPASHNRTCMCAWTALNAAGHWRGPAQDFFAKFIGGEVPRDIWHWNDAPGRTQAEVVAKLREAAALAREQGK